jgi:hypothetical protein
MQLELCDALSKKTLSTSWYQRAVDEVRHAIPHPLNAANAIKREQLQLQIQRYISCVLTMHQVGRQKRLKIA